MCWHGGWTIVPKTKKWLYLKCTMLKFIYAKGAVLTGHTLSFYQLKSLENHFYQVKLVKVIF